jgi:hypothetical protein
MVSHLVAHPTLFQSVRTRARAKELFGDLRRRFGSSLMRREAVTAPADAIEATLARVARELEDADRVRAPTARNATLISKTAATTASELYA